jgi:hypothetical protein
MTMNALPATEREGNIAAKPARLSRLWRDHEEGILYVVAAVIYVPAGVFLRTIVLNWMLGILFPLIVVYLIPNQIRRSRSKTSDACPGVSS